MKPYPRDLLGLRTPVNPLYPVPSPRDHDCEIHPDPVPADPERTVEDRLAVLERDIAWLRRAVQDLGTLNR